MSAVTRQDKDAFAMLMARHVDRLYSYALRLTKNPASAQDLVQETWLRVWSNAGSYVAKRVMFTTWLHRILYNVFVDEFRRAQRQPSSPEETDEADQPWQAHSESQTKNLVYRLLGQLPDNQRAALLLFYQQGFSTKEVAEILFLGEHAAESLLARARRAMRQAHAQQIDHKEDML